ncbi:MAG: Uma2 family endonuclease [Candidatus Riflebacteria bacterium]|nr:Uma2 family endonuclease [Candidatus Riflebacteria bacterium]
MRPCSSSSRYAAVPDNDLSCRDLCRGVQVAAALDQSWYPVPREIASWRIRRFAVPLLRRQAPAGHIVLCGISWPTYEALLRDLEDSPGIRVAYDRGTLEIMSPSKLHENLKSLLSQMLGILMLELNIERVSAGSTTWRRQDLERGLEPDECYYIASEARVRGKDHLDLTVDPPPDLAIEVDLDKPALEKLRIYAALGVTEVWKYDGQRLCVYRLQPDARYLEVRESASFPFLPLDELTRFLSQRQGTTETQLLRAFREWVRTRLGGYARP